jgi:hypothetical protein
LETSKEELQLKTGILLWLQFSSQVVSLEKILYLDVDGPVKHSLSESGVHE